MRGGSPSPLYLLAGGRRSLRKTVDPLLSAVLKATGKPTPSVAYVGAASGDDTGFFNMLGEMFRRAGSGAVRLAPVAGDDPDLEVAGNILSTADLIFISGGDVEVGMRLLRERGVIPLLTRLYRDGVPFFGLSAGSIMLARSWVRWRDEYDDETAELVPCLGLAPLYCDTHAEEEDWGELRVLLGLADTGTMGYGIPTGSALCVTGDGSVQAIGGPVQRLSRLKGKVRRIADLVPAPVG